MGVRVGRFKELFRREVDDDKNCLNGNRVMRRVVLFSFLMIFGVGYPLAAMEASIRIEHGHVWLITPSLPGEELLEELAARAGFEARVTGKLGDVGPDNFDDLPLVDVIHRLFERHVRGIVISYEDDGHGAFRVAKVRLMTRAGKSTSASANALKEPGADLRGSEPSHNETIAASAEFRPPPPPTLLRLPRPPPPLNMFR